MVVDGGVLCVGASGNGAWPISGIHIRVYTAVTDGG